MIIVCNYGETDAPTICMNIYNYVYNDFVVAKVEFIGYTDNFYT